MNCVFFTGVPNSYKGDNCGNQVSSIRKSIGRKPPFREDLSVKAEKYPLLEAVSREELVKTQQAGKDVTCAVVICKLWRLAMAL
jgi:hypothetical protein